MVGHQQVAQFMGRHIFDAGKGFFHQMGVQSHFSFCRDAAAPPAFHRADAQHLHRRQRFLPKTGAGQNHRPLEHRFCPLQAEGIQGGPGVLSRLHPDIQRPLPRPDARRPRFYHQGHPVAQQRAIFRVRQPAVRQLLLHLGDPSRFAADKFIHCRHCHTGRSAHGNAAVGPRTRRFKFFTRLRHSS